MMPFVYPYVLIGLVLIPLISLTAWLVPRFRVHGWEQLAAPRLRERLVLAPNPWLRWLALGAMVIALGFLIVGVARPRGDAGTQVEKAVGHNVLIALDISRSMRVKDVKPDRLNRAKVVIYELLEAMPNERFGLLGFAGSAHLYAPLTVDHQAVKETVEQIDEEWAPRGGSDLADALRVAIQTFKETGQRNNALVLLSDGEHHEGELASMIAEAERSGIYIFAVGVGTEEGGFVPPRKDRFGGFGRHRQTPILSRLDPQVMRSLAQETGGRYISVEAGASIPSMVQSAVKALDQFEIEGRQQKVWVEFYQWLVAPAVLCLIAAILFDTTWRGRRPETIARPMSVWLIGFSTAALLAMSTKPVVARSLSDAEAALKSGEHERAAEIFRELAAAARLQDRATRFRLNEATAAYRSGDFRQAREAFSQALLSKNRKVRSAAHLGMGDTLFQLGWQNLTGESEPLDFSAAPDLDAFEEMARSRLAEFRAEPAAAEGAADGFRRLELSILQWSDAVRHFESSLKNEAQRSESADNKKAVLAYLERLKKVLNEEQEKMQQAMPEPSPESGDPSDPSGDPGEESQGADDQEPQDQQQGDQPQDGDGDEDSDQDEGGGGEQPKDQQGEGDQGEDKGPRPGESPEERARRILSENADLEKGPLRPGLRRDFQEPEKDW